MDDEAKRKLQAKRFNENLKLLTMTINAIALVIFAASVLQPLVAAGAAADDAPAVNWSWVAVSATLHVIAHGIVRLIRPE